MLKIGTPERLDQEPIGTGPFMFVSFQKDIAIRYRVFPEYWAGRQPIDTLNVGYLAMNTTRPPFNDVRVRLAMNMLVDKLAIVAAVYGGDGTAAINPIPPTLWSYNESVPDYRYDVDEAQRLLVAAGYPSGFETDLWYMPQQTV
jgi:dipeptide transport system substrate-binding protein